MKRDAYGILAVIHSCDAGPPECDEVHFDGWYYGCPNAVDDVFRLFKQRYPEADVFVIKMEKSEWRQLVAEQVSNLVLDRHMARCEATGT